MTLEKMLRKAIMVCFKVLPQHSLEITIEADLSGFHVENQTQDFMNTKKSYNY
jgi:hypothetical protein